MKFGNFFGGKFYHLMDWILRLLILNILVIILSFLVFPMIPAYVAAYDTIKYYKQKKSGNIFVIFFTSFKNNFYKSFICGLIIIILSGVFGFSVFNYFLAFLEGHNFLFTFGFYFILFCILILLIILFHLPMVITYFNFRVLDNIRFSFYMSFRFLTLTFILIFCWAFSVYIFLFALPLWVMIGISGPLYIVEKFSKPYYILIANSSNKEEDRRSEDD